MATADIRAMGEALAILSIKLSEEIPQWVLDLEPAPHWFRLSLAVMYLSFAKASLPFLSTIEMAKAVDRHMDHCFSIFPIKQSLR